MEPMKLAVRQALLRPGAKLTTEEVDEYERLQAERFLMDPDLHPSPDQAVDLEKREKRLRELHKKVSAALQTAR